jgi:hypothetical protein
MDNDNGNQRGNPARFLIFILTVFLTITAFVIVRPFQASGGAPATVATYSHGLLHLTIAYHAARSGAGQLTIEILDPEDNVLGRAERQVEVAAGQGRWQDQIKMEKPLPLDDLVWHRVRYRFEYDDEARIQFRVTNSRGQGVHAALGLQVVDEAVFALAEKQPGFAKVFFYLGEVAG